MRYAPRASAKADPDVISYVADLVEATWRNLILVIGMGCIVPQVLAPIYSRVGAHHRQSTQGEWWVGMRRLRNVESAQWFYESGTT